MLIEVEYTPPQTLLKLIQAPKPKTLNPKPLNRRSCSRTGGIVRRNLGKVTVFWQWLLQGFRVEGLGFRVHNDTVWRFRGLGLRV